MTGQLRQRLDWHSTLQRQRAAAGGGGPEGRGGGEQPNMLCLLLYGQPPRHAAKLAPAPRCPSPVPHVPRISTPAETVPRWSPTRCITAERPPFTIASFHFGACVVSLSRRHCALPCWGPLNEPEPSRCSLPGGSCRSSSGTPVWSVILAAKQGPGLLDRYKELLRRRRSQRLFLLLLLLLLYLRLPTYDLSTASCRDDFRPPGYLIPNLNQLDCSSRFCKPPPLLHHLHLVAASTLARYWLLWLMVLIASSIVTCRKA
ncbi:hypothetical protein L249_8491 [Ophiocordyceps polyrhachis-furcata BCC 54312]|uniref:Uncharacterized protein n=1 Tax=Ophiocordyceps polyrhachis-furcata BCC 54312 TaxID=1330021 RepID=A0A367L6D1_9HYPO|nr:hypothetical protein L249_8491 [Ophiocordyceps polyrhachis-furcata BCC 54312]